MRIPQTDKCNCHIVGELPAFPRTGTARHIRRQLDEPFKITARDLSCGQAGAIPNLFCRLPEICLEDLTAQIGQITKQAGTHLAEL